LFISSAAGQIPKKRFGFSYLLSLLVAWLPPVEAGLALFAVHFGFRS
jgi:hypothetical protein